jgi:hypothetical protein
MGMFHWQAHFCVTDFVLGSSDGGLSWQFRSQINWTPKASDDIYLQYLFLSPNLLFSVFLCTLLTLAIVIMMIADGPSCGRRIRAIRNIPTFHR